MLTKKIFLTLFCAGTFSAVSLSAQQRYFDPLLDPTVEVKGERVRPDGGEYIWYPGQLSAHWQKKHVALSKDRCTNVGYPGKFYEPVDKAIYRSTLDLKVPATVEWSATGYTRIEVNGQQVSKGTASGSLSLPKGRSRLLLAVETEETLPSVRVIIDGVPSTDRWEASVDGVYWTAAETSNVFGTGGLSPMEDPETQVVITPHNILPVRNATINGEGVVIGKNGFVLVDFRHLELGQVSFRAQGSGSVTVTVGESPEEALDDNAANPRAFEQLPLEPLAIVPEEGVITLPVRALRYVRIFSDEGCEISDIRFEAKIWPVEFLMSFECDDKRINDIWNASVATLHTSTHGFYLDGIKRDYLPWSMDAVASMLAGDYVFGDRQVSRNGLSVALLPRDPQESDLGIVDYPLHAVIGFHHYLKRYGDTATIMAYRDRIEELLRFYESIEDGDGFISGQSSRMGFLPGWAIKNGPDTKGIAAYPQMMLYLNYLNGADLATVWGDKKYAGYLRQKAQSLASAITENFWSDEAGAFINGLTREGERDERLSNHTQYWAIIADLFPVEGYDELFADILPAIPYYMEDISFEKAYEFLAYSKAGKVTQMWEYLFEVFGDWLDQGHTRFPENFSPQATSDRQLVFYNRPYGLSLCHGANGAPGVVAVLHGIAGFTQSDTDHATYYLTPDLMHLEWANVNFPVKEGTIGMRLRKDGGSQVSIPAGCTVHYTSLDGRTTILRSAGTYEL